MAIRDLIPWSRQENRLPVSRAAQHGRDDHPLMSLHQEVNRLFDDVFRGFGVPSLAGFDRGFASPNVELGENEREIRIVAELPGLDESDVELALEDGVLTLCGEKRSELSDAERGYSERSYGRFERRIGLPKGLEPEKAEATFRNGVLTVTFPKSMAANENVRRIPVNAKAA
jgi:HSP20 family protein